MVVVVDVVDDVDDVDVVASPLLRSRAQLNQCETKREGKEGKEGREEEASWIDATLPAFARPLEGAL